MLNKVINNKINYIDYLNYKNNLKEKIEEQIKWLNNNQNIVTENNFHNIFLNMMWFLRRDIKNKRALTEIGEL